MANVVDILLKKRNNKGNTWKILKMKKKTKDTYVLLGKYPNYLLELE